MWNKPLYRNGPLEPYTIKRSRCVSFVYTYFPRYLFDSCVKLCTIAICVGIRWKRQELYVLCSCVLHCCVCHGITGNIQPATKIYARNDYKNLTPLRKMLSSHSDLQFFLVNACVANSKWLHTLLYRFESNRFGWIFSAIFRSVLNLFFRLQLCSVDPKKEVSYGVYTVHTHCIDFD